MVTLYSNSLLQYLSYMYHKEIHNTLSYAAYNAILSKPHYTGTFVIEIITVGRWLVSSSPRVSYNIGNYVISIIILLLTQLVYHIL